MRYWEICEGAVLANKERVDALRTMTEFAGGNRRFRVTVGHQTINNKQYQRITIIGANIKPEKYAVFKQQLTRRFPDLVSVKDANLEEITLFFKYQ